MSDKISKIDQVFLAEIPELHNGLGWHGKGTPNKDFSIKILKPVLFEHQYGDAGVLTPNGFVRTGQKYAIHPDGKPIGNAVGEDWNSPSNLELFEIFKSALAGSNYKIVSCGTVDSRNEFFIDAKGENIKAANRDLAPFVGLNRMFGGLGSLICTGHSMVIQCANTTALARRESKDREDCVSLKNSKYIASRIEWFGKEIEKIHGVHAEFAAALNEAANESVSAERAERAFVGVIATNNRLTKRTVNRVNRLSSLFVTGPGNAGQDLSDWYSAITDYYSHESAGSVDEDSTSEEVESFKDKQWYSSERGSGAQLKSLVTSRLFKDGEVNREAFENWESDGRKIIDNSDFELVADLTFS